MSASLAEFHGRISTRPQSKFSQLTDAEFEEGLRRLRVDVAAEPTRAAQIVRERYDVLVFVAG